LASLFPQCRPPVPLDGGFESQFAAACQAAGDGASHAHSARTVVVELKFNLDAADGADYITNALPLRLARCSKYVLGISSLAD